MSEILAAVAAAGALLQAAQGCDATFEMEKKNGHKIKLSLGQHLKNKEESQKSDKDPKGKKQTKKANEDDEIE